MADIDSWGNLILARKQVRKIRPGSISVKEYCLTNTKDEVENERRKRLLEEYSDKNEIGLDQVSCGSNKKALWKCKYGHEWEAMISSRVNLRSCCPY